MRFFSIVLGVVTFQVNAFDMSCKTNLNIVDDCYETRGKVFAANGNPTFRVWKVGTKRILGAVYSETPFAPEKLSPYLTFGIDIFGDYLVCPFTKEKLGHMQFVCIESANNLRIEDFRENDNEPKVTFIK